MPAKQTPFGPPCVVSRELPGDAPLRLAASWIWLAGEVHAFDSTVVAFREFRTRSSRGPLRFWVGCSGDYELWIDGRRIGRGPTPSSHGHLFLDPHVVQGLNASKHHVVVIAHNDGVGGNHRPLRPGGVLCQIEDAQGKVLAATDTSWRIGRPRAFSFHALRLYSPIGFAEDVDMAGMPDQLGTLPEAVLVDTQAA